LPAAACELEDGRTRPQLQDEGLDPVPAWLVASGGVFDSFHLIEAKGAGIVRHALSGFSHKLLFILKILKVTSNVKTGS
jgi:hypothetical protein